MNPAIKHFAEYAFEKNLSPYGVEYGLTGLIGGDIHAMTFAELRGIIHRGGTVLGSSRCPSFYKAEVRAAAAEHLRQKNIDGLVVLGGDGSFEAMRIFSQEHDIPFVGIPATIDNDVKGSETCLGVDTALNVIRNCLDDIRDTAASFRRAFVIEVMGRESGYLALVSAICSGAEICLIPEVEYDLDSIFQRLSQQLHNGERNYFIAIVAEGLTGMSEELKQRFEAQLGLSCRITIPGHIQRGGSPTVKDRLHAFRTTSIAVDALLAGLGNRVVLHQGGTWRLLPFTDMVSNQSALSSELLQIGQNFAN